MTISIAPDKKIKNASQWPSTYTRKFLEPGMVDYSDMIGPDGKPLGTLYLSKETIDLMISSFIDKPVIIRHQPVDESTFEDIAVGYIKNVYFNPNDLWYYVDFLITKDEGHNVMDEGWGVSCAYKIGQLGQGGKRNNVKYNGEIVHGEGEHLALVRNPRYEQCLMVVNGNTGILYNEVEFSKRINNQEDNTMWLFGKKEEKGFSPETMVDIGSGKKAKLSEIIAFNNSIADKHEISGKEEITLANGKKVTLEQAVAEYAKSLQNVATDDKEDKDEKVNKDKEKEEADGKDVKNAKIQNCGCGMKNGDHEKGCSMYNDKEDDKEDKKMENELKALKLENEALKAAQVNMGSFVKLENAKDKATEEVLLENGTLNSGTVENKLANSRKYFTKKA